MLNPLYPSSDERVEPPASSAACPRVESVPFVRGWRVGLCAGRQAVVARAAARARAQAEARLCSAARVCVPLRSAVGHAAHVSRRPRVCIAARAPCLPQGGIRRALPLRAVAFRLDVCGASVSCVCSRACAGLSDTIEREDVMCTQYVCARVPPLASRGARGVCVAG